MKGHFSVRVKERCLYLQPVKEILAFFYLQWWAICKNKAFTLLATANDGQKGSHHRWSLGEFPYLARLRILLLLFSRNRQVSSCVGDMTVGSVGEKCVSVMCSWQWSEARSRPLSINRVLSHFGP
ncbi:unnamed protein product [Rodentolepis nana]|uniref:Uncharacterized protein n=1 Tax=Rodentolepis nana TaxID=102285 RepID=A0A0R3TQK2_RODNA|nr:unnamed protein product [Rodentolepis nana]